MRPISMGSPLGSFNNLAVESNAKTLQPMKARNRVRFFNPYRKGGTLPTALFFEKYAHLSRLKTTCFRSTGRGSFKSGELTSLRNQFPTPD